MKFVIGLTGGIGSGKSVVADLFANYGINIIDADVIARDVVQPNSSAYNAIVARLGSTILHKDGRLNREILRQKLFNNKALKLWLENLLHPLIVSIIKEAIQQSTSAYCIVSAALLLESDNAHLVDRILVVDSTEKLRVQRTMQRDGVSATEVQKIIQQQLPTTERLVAADDVITNNTDLHSLQHQVATLHQHYLDLASQRTQAKKSE